MQHTKKFGAVASLALLAGLASAPASTAWAADPIAIEAGTGQLITLAGPAANVFAADPKVAEVRPASPKRLFVFGVAPGHTTVAALDAHGNAVGEYSVTVAPSGYGARQVNADIAADGVNGIAATPRGNGVRLDGAAATPSAAAQAVADATDELGKKAAIDNTVAVNSSVQVSLHVRVAEMSRSLTRELGINWQSINTLGQSAAVGVSTANALAFLPSLQSSVSFLSRFSLGGRPVALDTIIDALSQDQLVRMLAEPNLTALSGEPASFLVGGEFPIPVATADNQLTVAFKQYGISLAFVPTVLSNGQINLHVRPEVSQLTTQGAVSISSGNTVIQIPAITVRRADTTVELGSGQSFAIAGLLEDDATSIANGLPFLGDIPVLGSLFRSNSFQHNQTELVIVVTPYIVKPAQSPASFILPTDNNDAPNDLERILLLRQVAHGMPPDHRPIPIDAGFLLE
jgi:pilus assembly protein CpaC